MTVPIIRQLPPAPVRSDAPNDFTAKADAFVGALSRFGSDINEVAGYLEARAGDAAGSAGQAANSVDLANDAVTAARQEVTKAQQQVTLAQNAAAAALVHANSSESFSSAAQAAAAAAQAAAGLPAIAGKQRRPLRVNAAGDAVEFGGALQLPGIIEDTSKLTAATGAVNLNVSTASVFDLTLSGNITISFSGVSTGGTTAFVVRIRQGSTARTVTWPTGITWLTSTGTAPVAPAANKIREYVLSTEDGVTWLGRGGAGN